MKNPSKENSNVLVCTAGPEPAQHLKEEVGRIANFFNAEITVLKVLPHGSAIPADELKARGKKAAEIITDALKKQGIKADSRLRFSDDTTKGIIKTSEEIEADLIIIGVGKKPFWLTKFIKEDVTEKVIHEASCPVIALPQNLERSPFGK